MDAGTARKVVSEMLKLSCEMFASDCQKQYKNNIFFVTVDKKKKNML